MSNLRTLRSSLQRDHAGIGFRTPHFDEIVATRPAVGFVEVHAENYMAGRQLAESGSARRHVETLRRLWPVSIHGVGLSLGSAGGLDAGHLSRLADLVSRIEPVLVSEHLSWSTGSGAYLNDLLPLPLTEESLAVVAGNVARAQDCLGRQILIENPSSCLRFAASTLSEPDFLGALVERTGCGLLLDVNNIFVTCGNVGGDPDEWLQTLPVQAVHEIHLAGHCVNVADGVAILIDDHGSRVCADVWALYRRAVRRFPEAATLIEWDSNLPPLPVLLAEADAADAHRRAALGEKLDGETRDACAA